MKNNRSSVHFQVKRTTGKRYFKKYGLTDNSDVIFHEVFSWADTEGINHMTFVIIIAVILCIALVLGLILPVRLSVRAEGGTDGGFEVTSRVMLYNGFIGGGIHFLNGGYRLLLYILSWKVIEIDISRFGSKMGHRIREKVPKRAKEKKVETAEEKEPLMERLKSFVGDGKRILGIVRNVTDILKETVRFDFVIADITLGLGDPAMTGWVSGIIFAVNGLLPPAYTIKPSFDFTREVIRGDIWADITIYSIKVWKNIIIHLSDIIRFMKTRKKQDADIVTQEV